MSDGALELCLVRNKPEYQTIYIYTYVFVSVTLMKYVEIQGNKAIFRKNITSQTVFDY